MASPLENFVNNVRSLCTQGNYRELCDVLNKSSDVLVKFSQHLDNVLQTLDLQQHSLGVLAVLCVKLGMPPPSPPPAGAAPPSGASAASPAPSPSQDYHELLFAQVQEFISGCNGEQVRYAPETYAEMCHLLTKNLTELRCPMRGIDLLARAIRKIQLSDSQLTSIHADLCRLCLLAKCFKPALDFLGTDITTISQEGVQFDAKYFLLYYYYGGMIYTALKNFDRALYFFEVAITTPALAVSHIMLEAYKKYILVSLILNGKVGNVPKCTSQVVGRFIKPLSQAYHDLATVYASNNSDELNNIVSNYQEMFNREGNMGLVKQVVASLYKKNIQRLTKTFLTLSLSDVAARVKLSGPGEAEKYILNMIEDGEIFATINQKDGMVIFHDDPEKYNSPDMLQKLEYEMSICAELDRRIQEMEEEILIDSQYIKKSSGTQDDDIAPTQTPKMSGFAM